MRTAAKAPLYFIASSIGAQAGAFAAIVVLAQHLNGPWQAVFVHTLAATALAILFRMSFPWIVLNALVAPATMATTNAPGSSPIWFGIACALFLVFAPALWTRVPYYPTARSTYNLILAEIPIDRPIRFIDIGCGLGTLLSFLASQKPDSKFEGVELGLMPYLASKIRSLFHSNMQIHFGDFWYMSLKSHDVVYAFLSPAAMSRLWDKVNAEMKPGSIFITNSFEVPGKPSKVLNDSNGNLYIFEIGNRK